jgi:hypothetical protein
MFFLDTFARLTGHIREPGSAIPILRLHTITPGAMHSELLRANRFTATTPFDPQSEEWGFNFGRGMRRKGEELAWVSYNRSYHLVLGERAAV